MWGVAQIGRILRVREGPGALGGRQERLPGGGGIGRMGFSKEQEKAAGDDRKQDSVSLGQG